MNSTVTDIIIALGQRLNIELVAEGVETEEQAQYLRCHGVHILQGFLRPADAVAGVFKMAGGELASASAS